MPLTFLGAFWASGRQTGNYPETGFAEINGDLPEADFWSAIGVY